MIPADRKLRRTLIIVCVAVYLAGMGAVIDVAKAAPLRAITDVRYALGAYCAIALTCLVSMVWFSRRIAAADGPP